MLTGTNFVIIAIGKVARLSWHKMCTFAECCHRVLDSVRLEFVVAVALGFSVLVAESVLAGEKDHSSRFERIKIIGEEHRNGFFDISIEYGNDSTGWLAYSRVEIPKHVETHLAKSTDHGKTWTYVGALNRSVDGSAIVSGKRQKGVWRYETPTLLFDPADVPARRWKLFVQRYLSIPPYQKGNSLFKNGWIEYKYSAAPEGPWSKAVCLFGKGGNNCRVDLNSLHPDLKGNVFYNELGSIVVGGVIYLSMDASTTPTGLGKWEQRKVVLVYSRDHGITWNYAGTLTNHEDARSLGYRVLTGSSLVEEGGRLFLLITPSGAKGLFKKNRGHDGTLIAEFDDIRRARLKRDAKGKIIVLKALKPNLHSGGLSDYDEQNTQGGMLFSQINLQAKPEVFQIFSTKQRIAQQSAPADR